MAGFDFLTCYWDFKIKFMGTEQKVEEVLSCAAMGACTRDL